MSAPARDAGRPLAAFMSQSILDAVRVVLYEPQDQINIAAVVRAMKNMGVSRLRLVRPTPYEANRIEQIAHDTRDVVALIEHFDTLDAALADCVRVAAFTGRRRAARWLRADPRGMAEDLIAHAAEGPVAILFGREDDGLPSEAVDRAHMAVTIPTTAHSSLNVAQAALVALYELHLRAGDASVQQQRHRKHAPPATNEQFEHFFADTERALYALDFFKSRNPEHVMRSVRSIALRAGIDAREIGLLRAMSIEVMRTIDRIERRVGGAGAEQGSGAA